MRVLHQSDHQLVPAAEMVDQTTLRHPGGRGHLSQGHGGTLVQDYLDGRIEHRTPCALGVACLLSVGHPDHPPVLTSPTDQSVYFTTR